MNHLGLRIQRKLVVVMHLGLLPQGYTIRRGIDYALDVGVYLLLEEGFAECHELVGCHNHIKLKVSHKVVFQLFEF